MIKVSSKVKLNMPKIKELTQAQATALEMTAEALHTEVEQAFLFATGNLQNESTFVDDSDSKNGKVSIISSTPYARRLYFHPEYHFSKDENPNAKGKWYADWLPGGKEADFAAKAFQKDIQEADRYMTLADVRDYIASLNITESQRVYMGKLDVKPDKTIGVYHSKHQHTYKTAIGCIL